MGNTVVVYSCHFLPQWLRKPNYSSTKGLTLKKNTLLSIGFSVSLIICLSLQASDENIVLPYCNILVCSLLFTILL
jgi:hypothetical protein